MTLYDFGLCLAKRAFADAAKVPESVASCRWVLMYIHMDLLSRDPAQWKTHVDFYFHVSLKSRTRLRKVCTSILHCCAVLALEI